MDVPTPPSARAVLVTLKIEQVLPPGDPLTVPLLRLMIATDDVRHVQKLLIRSLQDGEGSTESDHLIHNGELGHLVRNRIAFHYGDQEIRRSYERHARDGLLAGKLVMAESSGLSRFAITDSLLTLVIADGIGENLHEFEAHFMQRTDEAIRLARQLDIVVLHLLGHLLASRENAIEVRDDTVTIPDALRAARDDVQQRRRKTDS